MCPQFLEAVRVPKLRATAPDPTYRLRDNPPFAVYTETLESLNKFYKRTVVRNLDKLCVSPSRPRDQEIAVIMYLRLVPNPVLVPRFF